MERKGLERHTSEHQPPPASARKIKPRTKPQSIEFQQAVQTIFDYLAYQSDDKALAVEVARNPVYLQARYPEWSPRALMTDRVLQAIGILSKHMDEPAFWDDILPTYRIKDLIRDVSVMAKDDNVQMLALMYLRAA